MISTICIWLPLPRILCPQCALFDPSSEGAFRRCLESVVVSGVLKKAHSSARSVHRLLEAETIDINRYEQILWTYPAQLMLYDERYS